MRKAATMSLVLGTLLIGGALLVQEPPAPPAAYGEHITMKQVKEPAAAAVGENPKVQYLHGVCCGVSVGGLCLLRQDGNHPVCIDQHGTTPNSKS